MSELYTRSLCLLEQLIAMDGCARAALCINAPAATTIRYLPILLAITTAVDDGGIGGARR